jgi:hypothetical protein
MDYNNQGYQNDGAFGWDDEIQNEDAFVLLPDGDYWFKIKKVEKGRYDGGPKISACPKAIVEFEITCPGGNTITLTENFLLHQKMEWKLSQFFASIGMKAKGEKLKMNWSPAIIGKTGICKIIVNKYTKDGSEHENNRIDKLYPSYDQPTLPPPAQPQQTYSQPVYNQPPQGYGQPAQGYQQPAYAPPQGGWQGGNR